MSTLDGTEQLNMMQDMAILYQNIDHLLLNMPKRAIQFIASRTGEGTSFIVREFASLARNSFGKSVLIIDGNTRSLAQCAFFEHSPGMTLVDVLADPKLQIGEALHKANNSDLFISAIAQRDAAVYGVLDPNTIRDLLNSLKEQFDLIVIDSAPALSTADGLCISSSVDGVVLVIEAENTRWPVAEEAKDRIAMHGGNLLGIVLNKRQYYIPDFIYKHL